MFAFAESRWFRMAGALLTLVIPALWLWTLIVPSDGTARIRSGLLFELGEPGDFTWNPQSVPPTFLSDKGPIPSLFQQAATDVLAQAAAPPDELNVSLSIARYLMSAPKRIESPIRSDLLTTLHAIRNDGRGYCADFTKIFNGIAIAAGVPVRQWGFAFDAFGSGHTFNEVFDRGRGKWILIDSFHSLYFVDPATREALSTLEVHDRLLSLERTPHEVAIERIVPARFAFRSDALAADYYRQGMTQLYLVWGNNVFDYETAPVYKLTFRLSRPVEEFFSILFGDYPRMYVYPTGVSGRDISELLTYRLQLLLAIVAFVLAALLFMLQAPALIRSRSAAEQQLQTSQQGTDNHAGG